MRRLTVAAPACTGPAETPSTSSSTTRLNRRTRLLGAAFAVVALLTVAAPVAAAPSPRDLGPAIEDFPRYEGPVSCLPSAQPGALALRDLIIATYGRQTAGIQRACGTAGAISDHNEGRAIDWMLDAGDPRERAVAEDFVGWLLATDRYGNAAANARRLGISYLIWDRRVWKAYRPSDGWQPYTGAQSHTDHIHISLTWAGADKATSWWTGTADPIDSHWVRVGGATILGAPVGPRRSTNAGTSQDYQYGGIYAAASGRPREVHGSIGVLYRSAGAERSPLRYPLTDEQPTAGGAYNAFQGGSIYWSPQTGAHSLWGSIEGRWAGLGRERSVLGYPTTDERPTPGQSGAYNHFERGSIYFSPSTGAQSVVGAIRQRWEGLGWESGYLGFPTTSEARTPRGDGAYNHFQGGSVYWSPATGAQPVSGAIRQAWERLGWEASAWGFPADGPQPTPGRPGAFQHFAGGSIYWSEATGAHGVRGGIREVWARSGWESGPLGMPTSTEARTPTKPGAFGHFERGSVYWSPATGARAVLGPIRDRWAASGWENGRLGFPVAAEQDVPDGRRQAFQGGTITWNASTGTSTIAP